MTTGSTRPQPDQLTRSERLDRLPFTRAHGKLLFGSGIGWALDAMDVGLISFVMLALAQHWQLSQTTLGWIGSIGFLGMALGASLGGLLADRIGRRQVFAFSLLIYGLATGLSALATGVAMLIVLRFIVGLGLGAELPVASTLVSEYSPRAIRGRMVVALESFWAVGWILAALISFLVIPASDDGWRWALAVGIVPTMYAVVVRFGLPESVRFLEAKGRHEEAEAAVRRYEESADIPAPAHVVADQPSGEVTPVDDAGPRHLWSAPYRRRTAALWAVWFMVNFSYYGAFIWLPNLIAAQGHSLVRSLEYTLIITLAQLPGYALAAWLIEVWGRRATLASFLLGSALAAGAFGMLADSATTIVVFGMCLSFFNLGAWGALYAVSPEIYPTAIRGTGTGAAAAFGRIASILAPLSVPPMLALGGQALVFGVFGGAFAIAAVAALFLPELKNAALEETV
ncbi:putative MFS transporter [Kineosphaera limosa]|uniref:Putative major facilitator superfamily transporter n=1 Tax=Kineosphaera limosa NBRC 100340 TaxID=1184609 RepID=K6VD76_9MICO|nr:MFS transporter [Kineosphaera limosa]NYE02303.1 putative MFS transporter [Kineosphaera limosa]GAB94158.1 putative major facilitator superfamily transporter [Kineosphaera limosa NBRC 100340]